MLYSIQNDYLSVKINALGAELWSIKSSDGTEYLWQGDSAYWSDRSPVLFPYIGRMISKQYSYLGKTYFMDIHGFALSKTFELIAQTDSKLTFQLLSSDETKKQYPWDFRFTVTFQIIKNTLSVNYIIENHDSSAMLFAVGGHPGFNVPFCAAECFEDYRIRFPEAEMPERINFSNDCFVEPHATPYPLDADNSIPLRHTLFDRDAIVLKGAGKTVVLEGKKSQHSVTVHFPDMKYIGFWHLPKSDAPYVCIEPWSSLPSAVGEKTIWDDQDDLLRLNAGATYTNLWHITVK